MLISSAKRLKQIFKFIIIYEASANKINTAENGGIWKGPPTRVWTII